MAIMPKAKISHQRIFANAGFRLIRAILAPRSSHTMSLVIIQGAV